MPKKLKQSTAAVIPFGPFVNPSDGVTLVTTLVSALDHASTGIFLWKNGGAGTIRHATVTATTYDSYGMYLVTLDTTDTNTLGRLRVGFAAAGTNLVVWDDFEVVPANVFDSLISGSDFLDVSTVQWNGGTIPAVNVTGVPLVDAKYLLGTIFSTPTVAGIPNVNAKTWNDLATVALPLIPTVAGRTLDVSAGGEAGVDWANVGSPTTVVGLSGTTIKTSTDIATQISALFTTAMTESYNADGAAPTPAQALFVIMQGITEFAISSTTKTVKKLDGSTTAYTETLDSSTAPTSITRAT